MKQSQSRREWSNFCSIFAAFTLVFSTGCRTPDEANFPRIINEPAPVPEAVRSRFGVMGVLPVALATNVYFYAPKDGVGVAALVAGKTWNTSRKSVEWRDVRGSGDALKSGAGAGFLGLTSLAAGAIAGALFGVSDEQFKQGEANLHQALREEPIDAGIQKELARALTAQPATNVRVLPESALALVKLSGGTNDLSALATLGLDSILDIRVAQVGFELKTGINPGLSFVPLVTADVVSVRDGKIIHASFLDYRGTKKPFTAWAEHDAKAFRSEMKRAERQFARSILEQYVVPDAQKTR